MLSNEYLYGTNEVPKLSEEVINTRIELLKKNLRTIVDIHHSKRDYKRQEDILKAIDFWKEINEH